MRAIERKFYQPVQSISHHQENLDAVAGRSSLLGRITAARRYYLNIWKRVHLTRRMSCSMNEAIRPISFRICLINL